MPAILKDSYLLTGTIFGDVYKRENVTEHYVSIPPALLITDSRGGMWTLGNEYIWIYEGHYQWHHFNVLRNDVDTDIFASRLEYRGRRLRALTKDGWKIWVDRKTTISGLPGYWL